MDPDTCLEEIRLLNSKISKLDPKDELVRAHLEEILERFENLDAWLSHGGFLPKAWNNAFERKE